MVITLSVFGVSNELIGSYIEREKVDGEFVQATKLKKQIIVYGSSKQGKTSLVKKQLPADKIIIVECSPAADLIDLYSSILRQNNVEIITDISRQDCKSDTSYGALKAQIKIPFIGEIGTDISRELGKEGTKGIEYKTIEYNLGLAQDVSEILKLIKFDKYIVLENFHYLTEEVQKRFSFDLRIFQDLDIHFIIVGIWRERNRLAQYNGDLQDRIIEVPVEPWGSSEFEHVITKGEKLLNVDFTAIKEKLVTDCFDSVGVLQELCKETCLAAGIQETAQELVNLTDNSLKIAIQKKLEDYSGRHIRSFETFASSSRKTRGELIPLFIPYYFIKLLLSLDFSNITEGIKRRDIHEGIQKMHHRPAEQVRASDISNFLHPIIQYQLNRDIVPPLFDYDRSITKLRVIDSTLYFFLRNCNKNEVMDSIDIPSDKLDAKGDSL